MRLYHWKRPTLTLGRFQSLEGIDRVACERYGIDVVRRFTGGRGVLHDDELTYAFVVAIEDGVPRGVAASYRHLCGVLVEAYRLLGVDAALNASDDPANKSSACYLQGTRADLSLGALKLSGSAQVWHGSTVLQHGSFVRSRDLEREAQVFRLDPSEAQQLVAKSATIEAVTGSRPSRSEIAEAIVSGARAMLGVELVRGVLSEREERLADELMVEVAPRETG